MTLRRPPTEVMISRDLDDFSIVLGGPLYHLLRRTHLSGDVLELARRRMIVIALFAWLPLLLLLALEGNVLHGGTAIPFLYDIEAHIRFLVAIPLLVGAELEVHRRLRPLIAQFYSRNLIPDSERSRFDGALAAAFRLRNSVIAEVLLIAFVYGFGILFLWRNYVAFAAPTWYATPAADGIHLSLAGMWYIGLSIPIFQLLLCRWMFRLVIWVRFLWQVSRIDLALVATHPDRVGGLGFMEGSISAFAPFAAGIGALAAGQIANRIFYAGSDLKAFTLEITFVVALMLVLFVSPLLVFAPQLAQVKRTGLREYGELTERYVRAFDTKWLRGGAPVGEPLIGSADVQSLADLGNSFAVVEGLNIAPITKSAVVTLALSTVAPIAPLVLTIIPLDKLIQSLIGIVL